ncbi:MAG: hypothetical protein VYE77_02280 [Planctomycetota bacterium]|nr:hypothetical protein [Planctomycetota bacterium]
MAIWNDGLWLAAIDFISVGTPGDTNEKSRLLFCLASLFGYSKDTHSNGEVCVLE